MILVPGYPNSYRIFLRKPLEYDCVRFYAYREAFAVAPPNEIATRKYSRERFTFEIWEFFYFPFVGMPTRIDPVPAKIFIYEISRL